MIKETKIAKIVMIKIKGKKRTKNGKKALSQIRAMINRIKMMKVIMKVAIENTTIIIN